MTKDLYFEELETVEDLIDWKDAGAGVGIGIGIVVYVAVT
jgi:hypothetical protein